MELTKYKLSQLLTIKNGKDYKHLEQGETPVFGSGGYMCSVSSYLYDNVSILLPRKGTLSNIQYFNNGKFWTVDTCFYSIVNESLCDPYYLYRYLKSLDLSGYDTGASIPSMTQKTYNGIKVTLPDLPTQHRIASILSAYDNLIENNTRRIRLLEQMAENLYKEWFVRFRFPGCEKAEFENGLPKWWREEVVSNIIDVMSGGTPKTEKEEFYGGEIPFYTPKDADDSIFVYSTITNITEEGLAHCNSQYYPVNTLMITARGTVGKLSLLAVPMAMNQSCFALSFKDRSNPYYLYYSVKNEVSKLKKMANGGVFDTIIVKTFDHIKIILPAEDTLSLFDKIVSPILDQIKYLQKESILLSRQRDLLLPRLMSGKLEVKE